VLHRRRPYASASSSSPAWGLTVVIVRPIRQTIPRCRSPS
jgi:hypothetical protein